MSQRDLPDGDVIAALRVTEKGFGAVGGPFHGSAKFAGGEAGQHMLGIEEQLHAEAAADIGCQDAKAISLDAEDGLDQVLHQPAALGVGVERPAAGSEIVVSDSGACLHRGDDDAIVDHAQLRHVRGLGEERVGGGLLADVPVKHEVVRRIRPDQWGARVHGVVEIGDGGFHVVVDHDGLGGIAPGLDAVGDDESNGIADMAHGAVGQNGVGRAGLGGAVTVLEQRGAGERPDILGLEPRRRCRWRARPEWWRRLWCRCA